MPLRSEDVLRTVNTYGPIIPNDIRKRLGASDSTLVNVYLSQLSQDGRVKRTNLKLGSSPFYYTDDQRPKIAELTEHLGDKDERTALRLKEKMVLRSSAEEPLGRVSLSNIPDFAVPIKVRTGEGEELFYRWFLVTPEDARELIKESLGSKNEKPKKPSPAEPEPTPEKTEPIPETKGEPPKRPKESQAKLSQDIETASEFGEAITEYLNSKGIKILDYDEVRKDSEIDLIVEMPTPVGKIKHYCKAKSKKSSNDGDLAAAILSAKKRMLPALYLTTGSVTQKAKDNPELQEITVVEIWE